MREATSPEFEQLVKFFVVFFVVGARPLLFAGFLSVVAAVLAVCWVLMLATPRLMTVLGVTGANVTSRLSGVILAALAVQFIIDGIRGSFI